MADTDTFRRRLSEKDFTLIASYGVDELRRREGEQRRKDLERQWKEVDRQVAMTPLDRVDNKGQPIAELAWLPLLELPWQAQALELLCADARRLMFPDDRDYFNVHAAMSTKEMDDLQGGTLIAGLDEAEERVVGLLGKERLDQEDIDAICEGTIQHFESMYSYRDVWDRLNAEAFKYGTFVARARLVNFDKFPQDFRGVYSERQRIPMLIARSVKNTYLDDLASAVMHEGMYVAPMIMERYWQNLVDIRKAAAKGSSDPTDERGGWRPRMVETLEPAEKARKDVEVIEMEGDLVIPRVQGRAMFLPNVIVTIAVGGGGPVVIRYREREFGFRSYITGAYHQDDVESPYGVSPLIKGVPIQKGATEAYIYMLAAGKLNTIPPVTWNPSDQNLEAQGGPVIEPGASWASVFPVLPQKVGEPLALLQVFQILAAQYENLTGVTAPRLGAQTKSHQTAFAIDTEVTRGVVRTVDYVRTVLDGSMRTWLSMAWEMIRSLGEQVVYLPKFQGYVRIAGNKLPSRVTFDVFGQAGPLEEREKKAQKQQAIAFALQIEAAKVKLGLGTPMNLEELQKIVLRNGGFTNLDPLFGENLAAGTAAGAPAGAGGPGPQGAPGVASPVDLAQILGLAPGIR